MSTAGEIEFRPNPQTNADDPLRVWVRPDPDDVYVIGADVAEGLEHGDYSCGQVLSCKTGSQVAMWHGHIPPDEFAQVLADLGRWYGNALIGVEANNHGLTTNTALRNLNYKNIYRDRSVDQVTKKVKPRLGWYTSKTTKPLMIDELGSALRNHELHIYDKRTITELKTFVRNERGGMEGSPHDDAVMSLAIANQMRKYAFTPEYMERSDDYWTFGWFKHEATRPRVPEWQIGANSVRTGVAAY